MDLREITGPEALKKVPVDQLDALCGAFIEAFTMTCPGYPPLLARRAAAGVVPKAFL